MGAVLTEVASLICCLGFRPDGTAEVLEAVLGTGLAGTLLGRALAVVPFEGPLACCFLLDVFWAALRWGSNSAADVEVADTGLFAGVEGAALVFPSMLVEGFFLEDN